MTRKAVFTLLLAAVVFTVAGGFSHALAQKPVTQGAIVTESSVVQAIDHTNRLVTLKNDDGTVDVVYAGPEVQRFDALKVGDKVTFKYYESMVFAIQQPGATPPEAAVGIVRGEGTKPGATISQQMTAVVTVKAIDLKTPAVTITAADASAMSFKVDDKKYLNGVKVGDKVQITYTRALAISVETPKK